MRSGRAQFAIDVGTAFVGAALFAGYAVDPRLAVLPFVSLIPWGFLHTDPDRPRVSAIPYLLASWTAWVVLYKQSFRFGWYAPPLMALTCLPAWWIFPLLMRRAQRASLPRTLTLPVVWVAVEWLRSTTALGHFDLFALGYSQARFPWLVQIADVTGVYGVSFLLAACNGLALDAIFAAREAGWKPSAVFRSRRVVACAVAVAAAFATTGAYGAFRLATARPTPGPRLAVIQPNAAHTMRNFLGTTLMELYQTDDAVEPGAADLIVWPENAILDDFARNRFYLRDLGWLARRKDAWLLLGVQGRSTTQWGHTTNTALLVDRDGAVRGRYDKQLLFPWSEYIPFDEALDRISQDLRRSQRNIVRASWGYVATGSSGTGMTLFELPWRGSSIPFAALICVENAFPPLVAEAGRKGARFFVNITSEGEVAGVVQEQLLRICVLRAIENRIGYVRCGNNGISAFIDPEGRVRSVLRDARGATISTAGQLVDHVVLSEGGPTVYAASHDAFALACVLGTLVLVAGVGRRTAAAVAVGLLGVAGLTGCGRSSADFEAACPTEAACRQALEHNVRPADGEERRHWGVEFYERVIATYPALAHEARLRRAHVLEHVGEAAEAAAEYETVARERSSARAWAMLGRLRAKVGDTESAIVALREAQALSPEEHQIAYMLARAQWEIGDVAGARESAARALALEPGDGPTLTLLAKIDLDAGRVDDARAGFLRATAADPRNLESLYHLSRLAWRAGEAAEARRWLAQLQELEAEGRRGRHNKRLLTSDTRPGTPADGM